MITSAQAMENVAAATSAMRCPTGHAGVVPVEDVDGNRVAALCTDCDQQLPVSWAPKPPRDYEAEHQKDHHGHPANHPFACRLCAEELGQA